MNMEEESKKVEVIKLVDGYPMLNPELEETINDAEEFLADAEDNYLDLKKEILSKMLEHGIYSGKVGKYTISVVTGKDTVVFDTDAFIMKEPDDIVEAFTTITEEETFDLEKFKEECPDVYAKYVKKHDVADVDTKRLESALPNVYKRYVTIIPSKKDPTIRVAKAKGGK